MHRKEGSVFGVKPLLSNPKYPEPQPAQNPNAQRLKSLPKASSYAAVARPLASQGGGGKSGVSYADNSLGFLNSLDKTFLDSKEL